MARTWHLPHETPPVPTTPADRADPAAPRGGRWTRRRSRARTGPFVPGGVIAVVSVLLTIAVGLYIGAEALHVDLGHLGFSTLLGRP